jgi:hypothetical protein
MDGRAFLEVAREMASGATEAHWRTAAGRDYYALMLEGRALLQRWGVAAAPRESMHTFVRLKFLYAGDPDLKQVGWALDRLSQLRNEADYRPVSSGSFATAAQTNLALRDADDAIARLDQIDGDATRRAAAIASIRP